jgi:hypothetical protein
MYISVRAVKTSQLCAWAEFALQNGTIVLEVSWVSSPYHSNDRSEKLLHGRVTS